MIYHGSHGNISLFYNGLLISNFPLSDKKQFKDYLYQGDYVIQQSKGINIIQQIETYKKFCDIMYHRKVNREAIYRNDHILFLSSLMALLRLKVIDNDDYNGYLIMTRRRCHTRCIHTNVL
mgnify:FL=1